MSERRIRDVSEREIALALVIELAESGMYSFALMGFYDNDAEFLNDLAHRLNVPDNTTFVNKLRKVVRMLVNYNVLHSGMRGTHKEYFGEPTKQMEYWLKPGKAGLIRRGRTDYTMDPEDEAAFLIRKAYPYPETD